MFGFLNCCISVLIGLRISCTKTQTLSNLRLLTTSDQDGRHVERGSGALFPSPIRTSIVLPDSPPPHLGSGQTRIVLPPSAARACSTGLPQSKPSGSGLACTRQAHPAPEGSFVHVWPEPKTLGYSQNSPSVGFFNP